MNKQLLAAACAAALIGTACSKSDRLIISGTITNAEHKVVRLERLTLASPVAVDSVKLSADGSYQFELERLAEPEFFRLSVDNRHGIILLADSCEHISVTADTASLETAAQVSGSVGAQQLYDLTQRAASLQADIRALGDKYNKATDNDARLAIYNDIVARRDQYKAYINEFVFQNPRSFVSYYALFQTVLDMQVFDVMNNNDQILFATVATSLNLVYPNNERVRQLYDYVIQAKAIQKRQHYNDALLKSAEPVNSPDIQAPDKDGNVIKLSSMRGKVILLVFWASQDAASRKANRQLVSVYGRYHDRGLEIYQVSLDQSKLLWEDAVLKDKLTWTNVCDLQGIASTAARLYNIRTVPSNYIIARNGELIGKDLWGTRLDERMAEIFR